MGEKMLRGKRANFRHPTVKAAVQAAFSSAIRAHHCILFSPSLLDRNELFPTSSPKFHLNFHFICISFPPGLLITSAESNTPFLISVLLLALALALALLLRKRRRDPLIDSWKGIFPLQIPRSSIFLHHRWFRFRFRAVFSFGFLHFSVFFFNSISLFRYICQVDRL